MHNLQRWQGTQTLHSKIRTKTFTIISISFIQRAYSLPLRENHHWWKNENEAKKTQILQTGKNEANGNIKGKKQMKKKKKGQDKDWSKLGTETHFICQPWIVPQQHRKRTTVPVPIQMYCLPHATMAISYISITNLCNQIMNSFLNQLSLFRYHTTKINK